jgi:hypothetical protein
MMIRTKQGTDGVLADQNEIVADPFVHTASIARGSRSLASREDESGKTGYYRHFLYVAFRDIPTHSLHELSTLAGRQNEN